MTVRWPEGYILAKGMVDDSMTSVGLGQFADEEEIE